MTAADLSGAARDEWKRLRGELEERRRRVDRQRFRRDPDARSQVTTRDAWAITGGNCGESLDGPVETRAPARKWVAVSQATVSLVQTRAVWSRPARRTKYADVCRLSSPVPSTAAVGLSPIRPRSVAAMVAR